MIKSVTQAAKFIGAGLATIGLAERVWVSGQFLVL